MTKNEPLVFTPSEAAAQLGVSRTKVYQLIADGDIPTIVVGSRRRVPVEALRKWVQAQLGSVRRSPEGRRHGAA